MSTEQFHKLNYLTTINAYHSNVATPTGSNLQGGFFIAGNGTFESVINSNPSLLKSAYSLESRKRMSRDSRGFVDVDMNIKAGSYLYVGYAVPVTSGLAQQANGDVLLKDAVITGGYPLNKNFLCNGMGMVICTIRFDQDTPLSTVQKNFILFGLNRRSSIIKDFEKLYYTAGSEYHKVDSFTYKKTYISGDFTIPTNPYTATGIDKVDRLIRDIGSSSSSITKVQEGKWFTIYGMRNGAPNVHSYDPNQNPVINFNVFTKGTGNSRSMLVNQTNPVETFGQTNYKFQYLKRLGDITTQDKTLDDFSKNSYIPVVRPVEMGVFSSIYHLDYSIHAPIGLRNHRYTLA